MLPTVVAPRFFTQEQNGEMVMLGLPAVIGATMLGSKF